MKIMDRYAGAVRSSNLCSDPDTTYSDSDVIGAAGLAGRHKPLAMALLRLFVGDNHGAADLVTLLSGMAWSKSPKLGVKLRRVQADDMARAVLAWHRDAICKTCGGHGYKIVGAKGGGRGVVSDQQCGSCSGAGKIDFDRQFKTEHRLVARWLLAAVEREQAMAGPAAMAAIAPKLDF